jgi:hypothetical protein
MWTRKLAEVCPAGDDEGAAGGDVVVVGDGGEVVGGVVDGGVDALGLGEGERDGQVGAGLGGAEGAGGGAVGAEQPAPLQRLDLERGLAPDRLARLRRRPAGAAAEGARRGAEVLG